MEEKIIDLNKIKVAIFDFDDTLAIHKSKDYLKRRNEKEEDFWNYYLNAYLRPETFYEKDEPCSILEELHKIIEILRKKGAKLYCVSGMRFSFHLKAKENFVHKHYGDDIEMIATRSQESKIEAIKIIQLINNCNLNEILFVDDMKENIDRFRNIGVNALLPDEVEVGIIKK